MEITKKINFPFVITEKNRNTINRNLKTSDGIYNINEKNYVYVKSVFRNVNKSYKI
jgi:hypothetical protein